jgi:hypothetical protein
MEDVSLSPSQRIRGRRAYGRTVDALDPIAWRPPPARRFDARPANDVDPWPISSARSMEPEATSAGVGLWLLVAGGGLVAAALGALMGGALSL